MESESDKRTNVATDLQNQSSELQLLKRKEKQLLKELDENKELRQSLDEELNKLKMQKSVDEVQMRELQDTLEAEQYFSTLYKTQQRELREEVDEKSRQLSEMEDERTSLTHQLQLSLARADAEALARSIAEENIGELEKEKTMKELEINDLISRHSSEIDNLENSLSTVSNVFVLSSFCF